MPRPTPSTLCPLLVLIVTLACTPGTSDADRLRFEVTLTESAAEEVAELGLGVPITGRLYVVVSESTDREPREQVGVTGVPFWGMDVAGLEAGSTVLLDTLASQDGESDTDAPTVRGYPLAELAELPPGEYSVQAVLNVYTAFERADGHTVRMHLNSGAGQSPFAAPGNVVSAPRELRVEAGAGELERLVLDRVIEPIEAIEDPADLQQGQPRTGDGPELLEFLEIRSDAVSSFWGRDMYIGANVLLPAGYHESTRRYPVIYLQGHFPGRGAPFGYGNESPRERAASFTGFWDSGAAPEMIVVTFRDANPYYDTSYSVDSANVGPYGTALTEELIPEIDARYRTIPEGWARITAGGSTGGWEALALQVFYPDFFGGAWGWCPDPVDFSYYQIVDIYEDDNAYWLQQSPWHRVPRPNARRPDGNLRSTVRMENLMELAVGPNSRSAGQWAIWEAVFGPVGPDGYPAPIWDMETGAIDREVAEHWRTHYDLNEILTRDWDRLGESLRGKLHVAVGDMDTYYLEQAVYLLEDSLAELTDPPAEATFEYGRRKPHCWIGYSPTGSGEDMSYSEFVQVVDRYLESRRPGR